jgi:hypothetical protein
LLSELSCGENEKAIIDAERELGEHERTDGKRKPDAELGQRLGHQAGKEDAEGEPQSSSDQGGDDALVAYHLPRLPACHHAKEAARRSSSQLK